MSVEHAKQVERHCSEVCEALMRASDFDNVQCAFSLASSALLVVGHDPLARSALGRLMAKLAHDLDAEIGSATLH